MSENTENQVNETEGQIAEQPAPAAEPKRRGGRPSNAEKAAREAAKAQEGVDLGVVELTPTSTTTPSVSASTGRAKVGIHLSSEAATVPTQGTQGAAAYDVSAAFVMGGSVDGYSPGNVEFPMSPRDIDGKATIFIPPKSRAKVPTGLKFDIPDGYVIKAYARSGNAWKRGLGLANGVAVIDCDYVDELFVILTNNTDTRVAIASGDRIAQIELQKVEAFEFELSANPFKAKGDRTGGLGHTGV